MRSPTEIVHPATGERITFDEEASDDGRPVREEWRPANRDPPPHHHPDAEERFVVREGTLAVRVEGDEVRLGADGAVTLPPRTPHVSYTGGEPARFGREVAPPGRWRELLTERVASAHAGGDLGAVGGLPRTALRLRTCPGVVVPERPPRPVQRVLFPVLAGVARATGRTAHHPYPRDASG